jgi:hypothetical protein
MLLAHPDAAQSFGGQTWSPEIADARQEQPGFPRFAQDAAGRLAVRLRSSALWLGQHRGDRSG